MKQRVRGFFLGDRCTPGSTYFWTILSGTTYAASSFLMFWLLARVCGGNQAGIFTLAMASGQQLLTIGYFNVRTYQVSDVAERFSFSQYFSFRLLTSGAMVLAGILWAALYCYEGEKRAAFLWILAFKAEEAVADVMEGLYQQKERYDVAGKCIFYETVLFLAAFCAHLLLFRRLVPALAFLCLAYAGSLLVIDRNLVGVFAHLRLAWEPEAFKGLFRECFPLFINSFFLAYLNNVAKYAVDASQGEEALSYFNMVYMPAFVMNLFAGFLFKPLLTKLSVLYRQGSRGKFLALLGRQGLLLSGLGILCLGGAWLLGIPVLSWFYHTDLSPYRCQLCVLVLGGVFSAAYMVFQFVIVVMRHQYACLVGCLAASAAAAMCVPRLARAYGMAGAAWGYALVMFLLSVIYMLMAAFYLFGASFRPRA